MTQNESTRSEKFTTINGVLTPVGYAGFEELTKMTADELFDLGCQPWSGTHWLYPADWYLAIPEGLPVTDIFKQEQPFSRKTHDPESRLGMLAYGFISKVGACVD